MPSIKLDVDDDLGTRPLIKSLYQDAAPHGQVSSQGRVQDFHIQHLVADKHLVGIFGNGSTHHVRPTRNQSLLLKGSLQALAPQYLGKQVGYGL